MSDEFWSGRTVLVTGAAGLLGGWVTRALLREGAQVHGFDIDWARGVILDERDAVVRIDGDVRDAGAMTDAVAGVDTVIHLAAQAIVGLANADPVATFEHNVLGTWTVLDACRQASGIDSITVASSDKAYGDHGGVAYAESMALLGDHPYAASKACTDILAKTYAASYGMPIGITRCGNMYGGGDTEWSRIVPGTIRSVLRGEAPRIRSDGSPVRDYLYVEDAADGVLALAEAVATTSGIAGEAFNLSAETRLSVAEVVQHISALVGSDHKPVVLDEVVNEIPEQRVSSVKAREVLGWRPSRSFDEGLTTTFEWYRSYLESEGETVIVAR